MNLYEEALNFKDEQIKWRHDLHQIPEIGTHIPKTIEYVSKQLDILGIQYTIYDASCIVATIGKGKHCILLRADMDGLPGEELSGLDFASTNGCMHACGHDLHAANLLGTAKLLKEHENELSGCVKLLFQSGEEIFKGAKEAIEYGVLENPKVDVAFAMHVFAMYAPDLILYNTVPFASVYGFEIEITGKGGHGSQPEKCIDPIPSAIAIYNALNSLISKECLPGTDAVLTIGQFSAGNAANAIPETAILKGTMRSFSKETADYLIQRIQVVVPALAASYRTKSKITELSKCPNMVCDPNFMNECVNSLHKVLPQMKTDSSLHLIGSEDFAQIGQLVPSCYFIIGGGVEDESKRYGQHNPRILFDENSMSKASAIYAQVAFDWLKKHGDE